MDKEAQYRELKQQLKGLLEESLPRHQHLLNFASMLKKEFNFFWVGFYLKVGQSLQIGPYQGEVPCFYIQIGKGACGKAAREEKTIIIPNVEEFPGYIACHSEPQSEMVVPGIKGGELQFVLDIDHVEKGYFDSTDQQAVEEMVDILLDKVYG